MVDAGTDACRKVASTGPLSDGAANVPVTRNSAASGPLIGSSLSTSPARTSARGHSRSSIVRAVIVPPIDDCRRSPVLSVPSSLALA
jgi:hypothetical protein